MNLQELIKVFKLKHQCIFCEKRIVACCNSTYHSCDFNANTILNFFDKDLRYYYLYEDGILNLYRLRNKICQLDISNIEINNISDLDKYAIKTINNIIFL